MQKNKIKFNEMLLIGSVLLAVLGLLFLIAFFAKPPQENQQDIELNLSAIASRIRNTAVAGSFYPKEPEKLEEEMRRFLKDIKKESGKARIIISPHAGTVYSGKTAAIAFKQIEDEYIKNFIVIGVSHENSIRHAAVISTGEWETPLGNLKINKELAEKFIDGNYIKEDELPHKKEHSIELEGIFIKYLHPDAEIVPILLGQASQELINNLAYKLAAQVNDETAIIISTDLSHYPNNENALVADKRTTDAIIAGDINQLNTAVEKNKEFLNLSTSACGLFPIKVALRMAEILNIDDIRLLDYSNSSDSSGDKSRVVGYSAIGFFQDKVVKATLSESAKKEALKIARTTLNNIYTKEKTIVEYTAKELDLPIGAFVTLLKKGNLRGCIGHFQPQTPLAKTLQEVTVSAALKDPRFTPVTSDEVNKIEIEISAMTPEQKIQDWQKISPGIDGVRIIYNGKSGTFLPQVATDNNWDLETFLKNLCIQKLGEKENCFKEEDARIYVYQAEVFSESEF